MPATSETLVALEQRLAERLLDFERLDAAWPRGRTAIERAEIGRQREDALYEIASLRTRIATGRADTLADAAVQLRRLEVMVHEEPRSHALMALTAGRLTTPCSATLSTWPGRRLHGPNRVLEIGPGQITTSQLESSSWVPFCITLMA